MSLLRFFLAIVSTSAIFCHTVALDDVQQTLEPRHTDYHYQSRYVRCSREPGDQLRTLCSVVAEKFSTKLGERCLHDFEPALKNVRSLCPTLCRHADEFEIVHKVPSNNHVCVKFKNYGLIKREKDVYLWRRGDCINETIAFTINCGFPFSRKNLERIEKDPSLYLSKLLARQ